MGNSSKKTKFRLNKRKKNRCGVFYFKIDSTRDNSKETDAVIKTFLVDDEPMALANLNYVLMQFPAFQVVGSATVPEDALEFCINNEVDVVFIDVEMPRMKGTELIVKLRESKEDIIIIFVTAYRDYAVKAFEANAQDYLLKPVTKERMAITVEKIESQLSLQQHSAPTESTRLAIDDLIPGKEAGRIYLLKLEDVLYFTAESRHVTAVTLEGCYRLQNSLSHWESCLPEQFFRCHNAYIVNLSKIEYIAPFFKSAYSIKIIGSNETVPVSRTFAKSLRARVRL